MLKNQRKDTYQSRGQSSQIAARAESPHSLPSPDKGTTVRQGVSEAGAIFPSACTRSGAVFCPHPLCPPLPQAGEGERAAGRTAVRPIGINFRAAQTEGTLNAL
jgi:hypothetical protein